MEVLVLLGHIPAFLSIFLTVQAWYFIYVNFLPFVGQLPYLKRVNPYKACLRIGYILLPWCEFLDVKIRVPDSAEDEDIDLGDHDESHTTSFKNKDGLIDSDLDYAEEQIAAYRNFFVNLYRILPFRSLSRLWGRVNSLEVPLFLRAPMYSLYVRLFNCNLSEALVEDLKQYRNLQDFFMRELKPDVRPVDAHHMLVSPCDGRVLHFGKVEKSKLEQVKGITYSLKDFLGPNSTNSDTVGNEYEVSDEDYHSSLCQKEGTSLYHCVIYLAPGDYHRFHSPTDWTAHHRRHFPGELLSVNPGIARWVRGLFNFNERVCITGDWQHGFFSFTAVGATNVGSISFYCDEELCTNLTGKCKPGVYYDKSLKSCRKERGDHDDGVAMTKGTGIGSFNLGSTIVLVFEAPKDFNFVFNSGDKIRLGERLGSL